MWYKNIAGRFFGLVTKHACDDGRTGGQNYESQDRANIWLRRAAKPISSTRPRCWIQISMVNVISIAANRQKHMTLTGELSWQRLRRSAVPGIWLCPPNFKWFTWQPCPFQRCLTIHELAIATDNIPTYLHSLRRYERHYKISKMGWFVVVSVTQDHWK